MMDKGANISTCGKYRYSLWRIWDNSKKAVAFIGLNPSTADETNDDPTIRRCIGFAKSWGYGGIYMLNIFAFRATDPANLKKAALPVGYNNNFYLTERVRESGVAIACWGVHGAYESRGVKVIELLGRGNLFCLGLTRDGHPKHPLYLKKTLTPQPLGFIKKGG